MDTRLNLWVIPDDVPKGTDKPPLIHYPHFSSTEIHTDFIDWYVALHSTQTVYDLSYLPYPNKQPQRPIPQRLNLLPRLKRAQNPPLENRKLRLL